MSLSPNALAVMRLALGVRMRRRSQGSFAAPCVATQARPLLAHCVGDQMLAAHSVEIASLLALTGS